MCTSVSLWAIVLVLEIWINAWIMMILFCNPGIEKTQSRNPGIKNRSGIGISNYQCVCRSWGFCAGIFHTECIQIPYRQFPSRPLVLAIFIPAFVPRPFVVFSLLTSSILAISAFPLSARTNRERTCQRTCGWHWVMAVAARALTTALIVSSTIHLTIGDDAFAAAWV